MSKYSEALDRYKEWLDYDTIPRGMTFPDWLKEQDTPKDELFEKWKEIWKVNTGEGYRERTFDKFKELFKDNLNGTKVIKEAVDKIDEIVTELEEQSIYTVSSTLNKVRIILAPPTTKADLEGK